MEGVVHSLKKKNLIKLKAVQLSFVSNFVFGTKCVCVWQYCHNLRKVMFYRDIYKYNTYIYIKNVYCMDMHWMFAQNLEERAALNKNDRRVSVLSRNWGEKCQKNLLCQNNVWTTNVFKPWLCDGRVLFLHLFLTVIFFIYFHRTVM